MLLAQLTNGEWIAILAVAVPLAIGFVGWLAFIALTTGKILQKLDGFASVQTAHTGALESHDDRIQLHDIRLTKLEMES